MVALSSYHWFKGSGHHDDLTVRELSSVARDKASYEFDSV